MVDDGSKDATSAFVYDNYVRVHGSDRCVSMLRVIGEAPRVAWQPLILCVQGARV